MHKYYINFNHIRILETILNKYEGNESGLSVKTLNTCKRIHFIILKNFILSDSSVTEITPSCERELGKNIY